MRELGEGLLLDMSGSSRGKNAKERDLLVRRLAAHGLLYYALARADTRQELVVIEPQMADYWPRLPQLEDKDVLVLSRFAYLRKRGDACVLESPRAGAVFKICDPKIASFLISLTKPQPLRGLRRFDEFPGGELLSLLVDCRILLKLDGDSDGARRSEGDASLVLWDFHDLVFHARSTEGRHANPLGSIYPHIGLIDPLPALRPNWPGKKIDLQKRPEPSSAPESLFAELLRQRHSARDFDDRHPITRGELGLFLDCAARVLGTPGKLEDIDDGGHAARPYPSAGAAYELELYLAIDQCEGLNPGFYHYGAGEHVLVPIDAEARQLETLLTGAAHAMGVESRPQILITIAARFGRISWKYSAIAYALILKDVGILTQTFYLTATEMGLGGCAIGIANIDLFEKITGIDFHVEGAVGQFALGRERK